MAHLNIEFSLSLARLRDLLKSGSAANLSIELTAGPISPTEDSHEHNIRLACLPDRYHYHDGAQFIDDAKFWIGTECTEDIYR